MYSHALPNTHSNTHTPYPTAFAVFSLIEVMVKVGEAEARLHLLALLADDVGATLALTTVLVAPCAEGPPNVAVAGVAAILVLTQPIEPRLKATATGNYWYLLSPQKTQQQEIISKLHKWLLKMGMTLVHGFSFCFVSYCCCD